jgi:pimeloyl-ACP methyl ester carboxylesterase
VPNFEPFRSPELRARFVARYDAVLDGWPVPHQERDVHTDAGTTHVIVSGPESAPPLVLLHGWTTTSMMWGPIIDTLSASYRCYCIDTITEPNKSVATRRARGVPKLAAWLRQVFAALDIDNARVAGFSYGGWLAASLAVHAPELVNRLVLLAPAATLGPLPAEFYRRVLTANLLRSPAAAHSFVQWLSDTPGAASDPMLNLMVTNLLSCRLLRSDATSPTVLTDDALRGISAHTTVLIGDREVVYRGGPAAALARAQALIPNVQARLLPGGGHALTVDAPQALAEAMVAALA